MKESKSKTRILLTFTGFHDPFSQGPVEGNEQEGPILSLVRVQTFDRVFLFSTFKTESHSVETGAAIRDRHPEVSVEIRRLSIKDPTDYLEILKALRQEFAEISEDLDQARYYIATASGTPQMHACWLLLVASGEIPARLMHIRPPQFVSGSKPLVSEVDLAHPEFPIVRSPTFAQIRFEEDEEKDFAATLEHLGIVGDHPAFLQTVQRATIAAPHQIPVLILAESGTGKKKIAALIHALSERSSNPLLILNCAAIPEQLAESELFGQKKGAFTGATRDQKGKFEIADGGTVFLDEVGALPLEVQAKLLRAIDTGVIQPLGGGTEKKVDVRVIAATNLDLKKAIKEGRFHEDLYYRLGAIEVRIPPLRERRSDIPKLAVHFLDEIKAQQKNPRQLAPETIATLQSLNWTGNVRELQNRVHQAAVLSRGTEIEPKDLGLWKIKDLNFLEELLGFPEGFSVEEYIKKIRLELYKKALEISGGKQSQAGELLGVTRAAVHQRLKKTPDL